MEKIKTDICIIGGGSGGLSLAAGAVQMGARVVLVEGHKMGGDCLNYGCVPSKSLLAAAKAAHPKDPQRFGVATAPPEIDFASVMAHVQDVIAQIAPHDSVERFEGLGVRVIEAKGRFVSPRLVRAGDTEISAKRFVIATGSRPLLPPIAGLDGVSYLTNETVFDLRALPAHLLIIGGGPIGVEMAQAFVRLGSRVSLVAADPLLAREDEDAARVVEEALAGEGIALYTQAQVESVEKIEEGVALNIKGQRLVGSHLLVAAGRAPNIEELNLDAAGIETARRPNRIVADARLRTSNKRVFAIGDVIGEAQFTHAANYHAGIVVRNLLFRLPAKANTPAMPRVTYCDPELAQVGLTEAEARGAHEGVQILTREFAENDRARAEADTKGFIKIVLDKRGKILGTTIVGREAGELLAPWTLALTKGLALSAMASVVAPYPTRGEANKHIAGSYFTPSLFNPRMRFVIRTLLKFMR